MHIIITLSLSPLRHVAHGQMYGTTPSSEEVLESCSMCPICQEELSSPVKLRCQVRLSLSRLCRWSFVVAWVGVIYTYIAKHNQVTTLSGCDWLPVM